jgi:hypothetical protein
MIVLFLLILDLRVRLVRSLLLVIRSAVRKLLGFNRSTKQRMRIYIVYYYLEYSRGFHELGQFLYKGTETCRDIIMRSRNIQRESFF